MSLEEPTNQDILTQLQDLKTTVEEIKESIVRPRADPPLPLNKENYPDLHWEEPMIVTPGELKNPLQGDDNGRDPNQGEEFTLFGNKGNQGNGGKESGSTGVGQGKGN